MWMQRRIKASNYVTNNLRHLCYDYTHDSDESDVESQMYFQDTNFKSYLCNLHEHLWLMLDFKPSYKCCICPCYSKHNYNIKYSADLNQDDDEVCRAIKTSRQAYLDHLERLSLRCKYHQACLEFLQHIYTRVIKSKTQKSKKSKNGSYDNLPIGMVPLYHLVTQTVNLSMNVKKNLS